MYFEKKEKKDRNGALYSHYCGYRVVLPEFDVKMSDVFLYAVPMMIYC